MNSSIADDSRAAPLRCTVDVMRMWAVTGLLPALVACGRIGFDALSLDGPSGDGRPGGDARLDAQLGFGDAISSTIHIVQESHFAVGSGGNGISVTWSDTPQIGDLIIAYTWSYSSAQTSFAPGGVTDNDGNSYTLVAESNTLSNACNGGGSIASALFYATVVDTAGDPHAVASSAASSAQSVGLLAVEYIGITSFDQAANLETPLAASPFTFGTSTTVPTSFDEELLASVGATCAGFDSFGTWTDTAGAVVLATNFGSMTAPGIAAHQLANVMGSYGDQWTYTFTGPLGPGVGVIATFH
jgi:hypothetical protein